ncbi:MAG: aspartate kinase [Janthinobacterium lividum]
MPPVVVKLGGSHADAPALRGAWLRALAAADGPVVLVPGGGPFADAVRVQQAAMGYGDDVAHDMALLAMEQYGLVLAAAPGFAAAASEARIASVLAQGRVAVWMPAAMLAQARGVEKGWGVTSDSLALWLAARLGARAAVLVKRDAGAPGLDAAFAGFLAGFGGEVRVAGPGDVPARLEVGALPGRVLRRGGAAGSVAA